MAPTTLTALAGEKTLQNSFVRDEDERPKVAYNQFSNEIPVISLAGIDEVGGQRAEICKKIVDACEDWGIFQVIDHGVDTKLISDMTRLPREFFALPPEEKLKYDMSGGKKGGFIVSSHLQPLNQYPAPATKKAMKQKNCKSPEEEIERVKEESDDSTELTVSCEFSGKTKKPRTSLHITATSPIEKNPLVNESVAWNMTNLSEREALLKTKNYSNKEVSIELTFFDESWINKKRNNLEESACTSRSKEPLSKDALESELNKIVVADRISAMKYYNPKEEQEESRMGVSTKLKLYEDPFKIKKKLTKSDLGNLRRLLVKTDLVKKHIFPYLSRDHVNQIESNKAIQVMVWDQDTTSLHQLIFKQWATSRSYVFIDKWTQDFVRRRDLKQGDEIGLYYDPFHSRFNFRVLNRA